MRKWYWLGGAKLLATIAVLVLLAGSNGQAQVFKYLPTLTLVKQATVGPNDVIARDTVYVAEAGPGETRYFLVPVFMKNILDSVYNPITGLGAEPIYSFRFKIQYNRTLIRAVGVQKRGQLPTDTVVAAKNFNLSWDVKEDADYKVQTVGTASANGERIMIDGSSSIPLPLPLRADAPPNNPSPAFKDTAVLLYVLFEVVGSAQGGGSGAIRDQMILTNDSIRWNDYTTSHPVLNTISGTYFPSPVRADMVARGFNPNPQTQQGIAPAPIYPISYPPPSNNEYNYGASVIVVTPRPRINLLPPGQVDLINSDPSDFELLQPLQTQYGNNNYIFRNLLIQNATPNSILRNVAIETDQNWLRVDNLPPSQAGQNGGGGTPPGERGVFIREVPGTQLDLNVIANPALLPTVDGSGYPTPGIYTGYITIRSVEAVNSAVRVKVVLIVNRNPLEPTLNAGTESIITRGIRLTFRNSAPQPDTTYLTFGTGIGARDSVDTLFGENEAASVPPPGDFWARFFPPGLDSLDDGSGLHAFRGMIDTRQIIIPGPTNAESSLDIRNFATNTTLIYCVRFDAGAPQNYPVTLEYDTRDFPNGAQLFIRDAVNGQIFSQNMRNATSGGGTIRQFVIRDPNVSSFCIEYTLPSVVQFPEINPGWNFVSMPVNPSDARSGAVFPNMASGRPILFSQNQYSAVDTVRVGLGYFVKYGKYLDQTVAGTLVDSIHELNTPFVVRVYQGWNTVGGLSVTTSIDPQYMRFGPYGNLGNPVRIGETYRYLTSAGYEQASLIVPGYGYWVKVDRDGYYRLRAPKSAYPKVSPGLVHQDYVALNRLTISDNDQKVGTLYFGQNSTIDNTQYELPPVPPTGMFDARFDNNGFVSASSNVASERTVRIQGVEYPLVLSVNRADADYLVTDAQTGRVLGTFARGEAGSVTITDPKIILVKLTGVASTLTMLGEAYPNPAANTLNFGFNVVGDQNVTITLYSQLGNQVATLFEGRADGQESIAFATDGLPSGVYYYKMTTSSGFSQVRQVVIAK